MNWRLRRKWVFVSLLTVAGLWQACYVAQNIEVPDTPPTFIAYLQFNSTYSFGNGYDLRNGIDTIAVSDSQGFTLNISFSLASGNPKGYPVTCYLTGLPPGATGAGDTVKGLLNCTIGYAIFVNLPVGLYHFNINIYSNSYGLQSYAEVLKVLPVPNNAPSLVGAYSGSDPCGYFSVGSVWYSYTAFVDTVPNLPNWISIQNFRGLGDSFKVYGFLPWASYGTINIPPQTKNGYVIYGRGDGNYGLDDPPTGKPWISIFRDTIVYAGDTQTCVTQLRQ